MFRTKFLISILLVLKLFGLPSPISAQINQDRKLITVIDPGHGGNDSGAVGINGILEKDVVLNIAKQIVELNNTVFKNQLEIYLTRYKDTLISLSDRTKLAKALNANLFLSLHCNYSGNPNAHGVEVYVSKKQGKHSRELILLAYMLQEGLKKNLKFESRGVKFGDFQVLRETVNDCHSILLEMGFLSNNYDVDYFLEPKKVNAIALTILMEVFRDLKNKF